METTIETRTDASLVYELLLTAEIHNPTTWLEIATVYHCKDTNVLALHQDWTRRYSTGQDA